MRMTPERMREAMMRIDAAPPGPWTATESWREEHGERIPCPPMVWDASGDALVNRMPDGRPYLEPEDAAFVAHARLDLPDALADLADARAEVERLREALREMLASGVEHDDPRIGYVTMQVDRPVLDAARAALAALAEAPKETP